MRRAAFVLLSLCVVGCFSTFKSPRPDVHEYRLDYEPPKIQGSPLPVVLHLAGLRAGSIYSRESIVYRDGRYETGTYYYHRWVAPPASMIGDLLARDFAASGLYRAVQQGTSVVLSDYDLSAEIDAIEERVGNPRCTAHLSLRVLLVRMRPTSKNPVLLQRPFVADEPCQGDNPEALVEA